MAANLNPKTGADNEVGVGNAPLSAEDALEYVSDLLVELLEIAGLTGNIPLQYHLLKAREAAFAVRKRAS